MRGEASAAAASAAAAPATSSTAARLAARLRHVAPLPPPLDTMMHRKPPRVPGAAAAGGVSAACQRAHPEFRIAIVMPWVTAQHSARRFPAWLPQARLPTLPWNPPFP